MSHRSSGADIALRLGERLRARRLRLGRTLAEVARAADVSPSYLSAVETGASGVSLPVLVRLARALGLAMSDLLAGDAAPPVRRSCLGSPARGVRLVSHPELRLRVAFQSSGPAEDGPCPIPDLGGRVFVYVHSGCLDVSVDDAEDFRLRDGDALDADVARGVRWRTAASPAVAIWVSHPFVPPP